MSANAEKKPAANNRAKGRKRMSQAERTAASDRRMRDAAIELICSKGAHNTTLKEIGELAGFSRGLASNRFGSKEQLFARLVSEFNYQWRTELGLSVGGRTGIPALLAALDAVERFLIDQPAYIKAMYVLWYESIASHSEIRKKLAVYHRRYREDITRWLQQGMAQKLVRSDIVPERFAVQFVSFIFGTIYQWLVSPDAVDVSQAFKDFRRIMLDRLVERRTPPG